MSDIDGALGGPMDHAALWWEPIEYRGPVYCYSCQCEVPDADVETIEGYPIARAAVDMCPRCAERLRDLWRQDDE